MDEGVHKEVRVLKLNSLVTSKHTLRKAENHYVMQKQIVCRILALLGSRHFYRQSND